MKRCLGKMLFSSVTQVLITGCAKMHPRTRRKLLEEGKYKEASQEFEQAVEDDVNVGRCLSWNWNCQ